MRGRSCSRNPSALPPGLAFLTERTGSVPILPRI